MKINRLFQTLLLVIIISSCSHEQESVELQQLEQQLEQPTNFDCGYVDEVWGPNAYLDSFIISTEQTSLIYQQNTNIYNTIGATERPLKFVHDNVGSTANAIAYRTGKIYFGEDLYRTGLQSGQIVPISILAHEVGHQAQYQFNLPSRTENTARATELEADGFSGYYLKRPNGYNATWEAAAPAFQSAFNAGSNDTTSPGHHGTPGQRRSASRLGWYLGSYSLNPTQFDSYFFYYYNYYVLGANLRASVKKTYDIDPMIDTFILSKIDELKKLNTNELTEEDFLNLE